MVINVMSSLNNNADLFNPRLIDNLRDIPYTVFEHLLDKESILRLKQKEAVETTAQMIFEENLRAIAMIMPTSTGKTVILARILAGLQQDEAIGHLKKRVIIITDTKEGVINTREKLKLFANINAGVFYSDEKNLNSHIIVTTYQSWQDPDFPLNPEDDDMVVLDEAHEAISEARLAKLKQHKNALWLALTASPTYSQERSILQYFGLGYRMSVEEAVEHSLIASLRNVVLNSNIEVDLSQIEESGKDFDHRTLAKVINTEARNRIGAEYLLAGRHFDTGMPIRNIQGLISCIDVKHAHDFAKTTNAMYNYYFPGQAPEHGFIRYVSGSMKERRDILNWHREGKIRHLAFADLLIQNYDDCGIGMMLNLRPSLSWVLNIQRGGRPGRLNEVDPGKISLIVDMFDKYKGRIKRKPLFYSHVIGTSSIITKEAQLLAKIQKEESMKYEVMDRNQRSDIEKLMQKVELNIVTDEESILSLFSPEEQRRAKTLNDLSLTEIASLCEISETPITTALKRLLEDERLYESDPEKYPKPEISTEIVNTKRGFAGNRPTLVIPREKLEIFKEKYLPMLKLRLKTEEDLGTTDVVELTKLGDKRINTAFNKLKLHWSKYEQDPISNPKPKIEIEIVRMNTGNSVATIKKEKIEIFISEYLKDAYLRKKTIDDLSVSEIAEETGAGKTTIRRQFDKIKTAWKAHELDPIKYTKPEVFLEKVQRESGLTTETLHRGQLALFKLNFLPKKVSRDDYYLTQDIVEITGLTLRTIQRIFKFNQDAQKAHKKDPSKFALPEVLVEKVVIPDFPNTQGIKKCEFELYKSLYLEEAIKTSLLPKATDKHLTLKTIVAYTGSSEAEVLRALNQLKADWKAHEADPENIKSPSVKYVNVNFNSKPSASILDEEKEEFVNTYMPTAFLKEKTTFDLIASEIALITGYKTLRIQRAFQNIRDGDNPSNITLSQIKSKNKKTAYSISLIELEPFIRDQLPNKIKEFLLEKDKMIGRLIPGYKSDEPKLS